MTHTQSFTATTTSPAPGATLVLLEGHLVIKNAAAIKKELLAALNSAQHIVLEMRNIAKLDLTVLQLFIAMQKSAVALGKIVSCKVELPAYAASLIKNSGFAGIFAANFQTLA